MKGTARTKSLNTINCKAQGVTLFVSYSNRDHVWMRRLEPVLTGLKYDDRAKGLVGVADVSVWHDSELHPGDEWDDSIQSALGEMDIFVPLVSMEFFASRYVMTVELPEAEARHARGEIHVVPILLQDVNLRKKCAFLNKFNPLPAWGRWWSSFRSHAHAHRAIDDGLWDVIERVLAQKISGNL